LPGQTCRSLRSLGLGAWGAQTRPHAESGRFAGRSNKCTPRANFGTRGVHKLSRARNLGDLQEDRISAPHALRLPPSHRSHARDGPQRAGPRSSHSQVLQARRQNHPVPAHGHHQPRIESPREAARIFSPATSSQPIDHRPELHTRTEFLYPTGIRRVQCAYLASQASARPGRVGPLFDTRRPALPSSRAAKADPIGRDGAKRGSDFRLLSREREDFPR
jgi:hypothetical protein